MTGKLRAGFFDGPKSGDTLVIQHRRAGIAVGKKAGGGKCREAGRGGGELLCPLGKTVFMERKAWVGMISTTMKKRDRGILDKRKKKLRERIVTRGEIL